MRSMLKVSCSSTANVAADLPNVREVPRKWVRKAASTTHAAARDRAKEAVKLQKKLYAGSQPADPLDAPSSSGRVVSGAPDIVRERLLRDVLRRKKWLQERDLTRMDIVVPRLISLSLELDVDVAVVARMAAVQGSLLLVPPNELRERLDAISKALLMDPEQVLELTASHPELISRPVSVLRRSLPDLVALFKSRGLPLAAMVAARPDLLLESPHSLKSKIDGMPAALDLNPGRTRDLLVSCPGLLRRSTRTLQERHQALLSLFSGLPRAFVTELLAAAPSLLMFSPQTLRAKFNALLARYGSFADDVVDMVLVDPSLLLSAEPLSTPTTSGSYDDGDTSGHQTRHAAATGPTGTARIRPVQAPPAAGPPTPVGKVAGGVHLAIQRTSPIDQLLKMAAQAQVPLYDMLQLCMLDSGLCQAGPGVLVQRVDVLRHIFGLPLAEAQALVSRLPGILSLSPEQLTQRAAVLAALMEQQGPGTEGNAPAPVSADGSAAGAVSVQAQALIRRHPELLLQDSEMIRGKLATLQQVLGVPLGRLLRLLESQPGVVLGDTQAVVDRLEALQQLLGDLPLRLVGELATKEPRLLQVPLETISARFDALAASFGSFKDDAVDIVLADPTKLLPPPAVTASSSAGSAGSMQGATLGVGARAQQGLVQARPGKAGARKSKGGAEGGVEGGPGAGEAGGGDQAAKAGGQPDFNSLLDEMILGESARAKEKEQRRMKARREKKAAKDQQQAANGGK